MATIIKNIRLSYKLLHTQPRNSLSATISFSNPSLSPSNSTFLYESAKSYSTQPNNEKRADEIIGYLLKMSQFNNKSLKISIEGNIASGKTSIIDFLQQKFDESLDFNKENDVKNVLSPNKKVKLDDSTSSSSKKGFTNLFCNNDTFKSSNVNFKVLPEPVNLWRDLNGANLLELMYTDPKRWAFAFHSYVQLTMLENHIELSETNKKTSKSHLAQPQYNVNIMERSLYSARYCFVENINKSNIIQPVEYEIYNKWFEWMIKNHDCSLDIVFYLRTNPETCMRRLYERGRPEETSSISLEYLKNLHDLHEKWLNSDSTEYYRPQSVIIIDADQSIDQVYKEIELETQKAVSISI